MKRFDVVSTPTELAAALTDHPGATCAVIDVVRATTTLAVIGERQGARILIAQDVETARALAVQHPNALLAGEVKGLPPPGFDFGNSPARLAQADLAGRTIIFATTNGTKTIHACQTHGARQIITAALRNASAVVEYALQQQISDFLLVCAGRAGRVALDDLYTAGIIVQLAQQMANEQQIPLTISERGHIASLVASNAGSSLEVLSCSDAGRAVIKIGYESDLDLCAEHSVTSIIPHIHRNGNDSLIEVRF